MLESSVFKSSLKKEFKFNYLLYLPDGYTPQKKLPLVVFLHGAGERGGDVERIKLHGIAKLLEKGLQKNCIFLCPQCAAGMTWNSQLAELVELIKYIAEKYNADEDRISITGLSMGGYGTWECIICYPHLFSAAAPICGGGMHWRLEPLKNLPIRVFHGADDSIVPPESSREMVKNLKAIGGNVEYTELPGVAHNSWNYAYESTDLIDWLISQVRSDSVKAAKPY